MADDTRTQTATRLREIARRSIPVEYLTAPDRTALQLAAQLLDDHDALVAAVRAEYAPPTVEEELARLKTVVDAVRKHIAGGS